MAKSIYDFKGTPERIITRKDKHGQSYKAIYGKSSSSWHTSPDRARAGLSQEIEFSKSQQSIFDDKGTPQGFLNYLMRIHQNKPKKEKDNIYMEGVALLNKYKSMDWIGYDKKTYADLEREL